MTFKSHVNLQTPALNLTMEADGSYRFVSFNFTFFQIAKKEFVDALSICYTGRLDLNKSSCEAIRMSMEAPYAYL